MQKIIKELFELENKTVAVVGLGKSGIAASKLLCSLGAKLIINDKKAKRKF